VIWVGTIGSGEQYPGIDDEHSSVATEALGKHLVSACSIALSPLVGAPGSTRPHDL
jgi:hypothetical protein